MQNSGVDEPDIVVLELGVNGNILGLEALAEMVESIRDYDATMPIIVGLCITPAHQSGYAYLNLVQNTNRIKELMLETNEVYLSDYENGQDANIDVADISTFFDNDYDFETTEMQASARNPAMVNVQKNNIHPSKYGYYHMADGFYNRIMYWLTR